MSVSIFYFNDKLYKSYFGINRFSDVMLNHLGLNKDEVVRYIDIGVTDDVVWVLSRASNNPVLKNNEYYLHSEVDKNDSTYYYFTFKIPELMCLDKDFRNFIIKKPNFKKMMENLETNPSKVLEIANNVSLSEFLEEIDKNEI